MKGSHSKTAAVLLAVAFLIVVVGGPYSWLIWSQCGSTGLGEFWSDFKAFHTMEGC